MVNIPITADASQEVTITLGGVVYVLTIKWGELRGVWTMDITRVEDSTVLARGVAMLIGGDILKGFGLAIGSMYMVDTSAKDIDATVDDLGDRVLLYYFEPGES